MFARPVVAPADAAPLANAFSALGVPAPLVRLLSKDGVVDPFPIQTATLPDSLAGRDVLGQGGCEEGTRHALHDHPLDQSCLLYTSRCV